MFFRYKINLFWGFSLVALVAISLILISVNSFGQGNTIIIKGTVLDAQTKEPIPFAGVEILTKNLRTPTNMDGSYSITLKVSADKIKFSCVGYTSEIRKITPGKSQIINVTLKPSTTELSEVVVRPTKKRYKNKDNPAVELVKQVIEHKPQNRKEGLDYYEYEKYEKIEFALSNFSEKFKQRKALKKFQFVFDNVDSTKVAGAKILPVYLKETLSDYYFRKSPKTTKEVVKANKMVSFEGYVDNQGLSAYLGYMYQDINIYDNDISFLSNRFLSPIASTSLTFYKYFIIDTTVVSNSKCVKVLFSPRNKTDMLFQGFMYITLDSLFAVKKMDASVNKDINLNWVKEVNINQEFTNVQGQGWMLTTDEISMDFGVSKNSMGVFGQRSVSYKNYKIEKPRGDSIYKGPSVVEAIGANEKGQAFWEANRHQQLSKSEKGIYTTIDSVKRVPAFKRTMNILMLVVSGYRNMGYFEIGPVNTFYSYNPIEGVRVRFGGRTTPQFNKKINFETYLAYGFTDDKYKYYLGATYSLTNKTIYEFPVKSLKVSVQNETKIPGQELQFIQEDNVLLSIKRGVNDKLFYNRTFRVEQLNEFSNHFSYTIGYNFLKQSSGGNLYFNTSDYLLHTNSNPFINISEVFLTLRYAPHEQFYQGKQYRIPIANKYPIFQLQLAVGSKALHNDYDYQNIKLSISKRFYPWVLGYTDVIWEAGKIFGTVPYPLLAVHRANQTYSYQIASYNLMNFLEFVSDQYTSLNVDHCFNGFIFNKLPLIKKLKFREVVTCKILYGSLSNSNRPENQPNLFKLPVNTDGTPITYTLENKPYIEASAGVSNILKFFRVDVVKRLTYLEHPNVASTGIRVRFKFDF